MSNPQAGECELANTSGLPPEQQNASDALQDFATVPATQASTQLYEAAEAEAPQVPHALKLECFEGPCKGTSFSRGEHLQTVGRTRTSKIWIKDPAVSEKHAELEWAGGVWFLRDVGSSNGTKVNGITLDAAGQPVELKDGDLVQFGDETLCNIKIAPIPSDSVTVEQFLQAEMHRMQQHATARLEQLASKMREEWKRAKRELLAEMAG